MAQERFITIEKDQILACAQERKSQGWRLVECHANRPLEEGGPLMVFYSYSDDEHQVMEILETQVNPDEELPSVSSLFPCAFVFENEMHDLYGLDIKGILIDYQGAFYRVLESANTAPMTERPATPARKPVPRPAAEKPAAGATAQEKPAAANATAAGEE